MSRVFPQRRSFDLSVQHVGQEILVYDELTHKAFCLNPIASEVWSHCNGTKTIEDIADVVSAALQLPVTEELVHLSIQELEADGLLETVPTLPRVSRRDVMIKLGVRAAVLLPFIAGMTAPAAAQAYSGCADC